MLAGEYREPPNPIAKRYGRVETMGPAQLGGAVLFNGPGRALYKKIAMLAALAIYSDAGRARPILLDRSTKPANKIYIKLLGDD